jgi:hypothetical protein
MGLKHGQGEIIYQTGEVYRGPMNEDKPAGEGVMTYKNNDIYEGSFKDGQKHG